MAEPYLIEEAAAENAVAVAIANMSASVIMEAVGEVTRSGSAAATEGNATDGSGGGPGGGALTLPPAAIKFADLTESGSESGDGDPDPEPGTSSSANARSSPPPNCAICLSRCRHKCFTDSCMHQFCFKCLSEWSKVKPECPLCKQPFKTIIHNVRTLDDYDRYPVQSSTPSVPDHSSLRFHVVNIGQIRPRYMPLVQNQGVMTNDLDAGNGGVLGPDIEDAEGLRVNPSLNRFMELMSFYRHDQDAVVSSSSLSQLWRRYVYDRKLYAQPVRDNLTGQFREWSARFYRNNPAQMHRLMPWIHRDLVCLLRNVAHNVSTVMHLMHEILTMTNILGPTFRRRLTPHLGERTSHFIHELFNFARSPFDMIGYDRVVQYSARAAEEVEVDLLDMGSPESSNDSDVHLDMANDADATGLPNASETDTSDYGIGNPHNRTAPARPSTSVIVTNPSATHSFSVTMASDGSEIPGISIRRTTTSNVGSQTVAINLSMRRPTGAATSNNEDEEVIEIDDGDAAANAEVAAINDGGSSRRHAGASLPISAHIELNSDCSSSSSSTDDDECVFVLERKPPHLRTPELVSLDSNSDSDVVFVDEQKAVTVPTAPDTETLENTHAGEQTNGHVANELFLGPSTSSGVCSGTGKNWKKVLEMARQQEKRSSARQKRSTRSQRSFLSAAPSISSSSSSSSDSSSSAAIFSSSTSEDDSGSDAEAVRKKQREARKLKARKRSAKGKLNKTPRKRRRRQLPQQSPEEGEAQDEEQEQDHIEEEEEKENSSSSSISSSDNSDSSEASDRKDKKQDNSNNSSSDDDDDDDDDSSENLQLSALRATLKAEAALEDLKPLKLELPLYSQSVVEENPVQETEEENTQPDLATLESNLPAKRRRSCSSSNLSNQSASLASNTTTTSSSLASGSALSPFKWQVDDPLMRGSIPSALDEQDIANSLIELSTLTQQRSEPTLFNDTVEDVLSFLGNPLPSNSNTTEGEAHMGIYSDTETSQQFPLDVTIDVVGETNAAEEAETEDDEDDDDDDDDADDDADNDADNDGDNDADDADNDADDADNDADDADDADGDADNDADADSDADGDGDEELELERDNEADDEAFLN